MFTARIALLISVFLLLLSPAPVFAQAAGTRSVDGAATLGVARIVETSVKDLKDGSILTASGTGKGAVLTTLTYDPQVVGVVARDAAIIINQSGSDGVPVISNGNVYVLVSSIGGNIKKGDLITTSTIPGVGQKAVKSGYIIGTALEDYENSDPKQSEKIAIDLDLHYFNAKPVFPGSLTDVFKIAILSTKDGPNAIFKYIVAAVVALGSLVLGFMSFGRTAAKGVEALGRNPAASRVIHLGIIFNVFIVVVIALSGLTIAFLILRL